MDLKPGDIITAWTKGIHEVVQMEQSEHYEEPILCMVRYRRRLNSNGKKAPHQELTCHINHCKKVTQQMIDDTYASMVKKADRLKTETEALLEAAK